MGLRVTGQLCLLDRVTLGPEGEARLRHVQHPHCCHLISMPHPLDVPNPAFFSLPNVLIARCVPHMDTWRGPNTVQPSGLPV